MAHHLSDIRLIGSCFQRFGISDFQRSGIYVFLIAFACVYYLINAPLLLSHWDLGWHLAAGDLIRDQADILSMIHGHSPPEAGSGSIFRGFGT
jgi:hypothetical protein